MISIEPFDAHWESTDDNGKRFRHPCRVVGICGDGFNKAFIVIATDDEGDAVGTFEVDRVFMRDRPAKK